MLPLAAITGANFNKLHPQARSYFEDIATKLGILVGHPVKTENIEVWAGSFESFFKSYTKNYMLTQMTWDGKEGFLLFMVPIPVAITLSGFMMGVPANSIKDKVQKMQFDPDLVEAYGEVSNQLWGNLNQALIAKIDKNIRLSLKSTVELTQDGAKNSEVENSFYVILKSEIKVAELDPQPFYFFLTHLFVKDIFDVTIDPSQGSEGGESRFQKLTSDLDAVTVQQLMILDYPTIQAEKTLKEAHQLMMDKQVDSIPLIQNGRVVRVITKNNLEIIKSVFFDAPGQEERNRKIMQFPLLRVSPDQKLAYAKPQDLVPDAVKKMHTFHLHTLPVLGENSEFLGMLFSLDLLRKILG